MKNIFSQLLIKYAHNTLFFILLFSLINIRASMEIKKYDALRDRQAIVNILDQHAAWLRYEATGSKNGTTESYLENPTYKTDILQVDDQTVGFVNYRIYDFSCFTFKFKKIGYIHLIGIDKKYQKRGLGKKLLQYAMQELKSHNASKIMLTTKKNNKTACALYEKEGFVAHSSFEHLRDKINANLEAQPNNSIILHDRVYEKNVIPAQEEPGNIIQRHPKVTLSLIVGAAALYLFN